jgi:hypothetical protein
VEVNSVLSSGEMCLCVHLLEAAAGQIPGDNSSAEVDRALH